MVREEEMNKTDLKAKLYAYKTTKKRRKGAFSEGHN
jgi:hypothetical protein